MSSEVQILGVTTTTETEYIQAKEEVLDVSQFTEAALVMTVFAMNRNSGTTEVKLETSIDLADDRWVQLNSIKSFAADPSSFPHTEMLYLAGPGAGGGSDNPGFGRYLRISLTQASGASITLDVRAICKP